MIFQFPKMYDFQDEEDVWKRCSLVVILNVIVGNKNVFSWKMKTWRRRGRQRERKSFWRSIQRCWESRTSHCGCGRGKSSGSSLLGAGVPAQALHSASRPAPWSTTTRARYVAYAFHNVCSWYIVFQCPEHSTWWSHSSIWSCQMPRAWWSMCPSRPPPVCPGPGIATSWATSTGWAAAPRPTRTTSRSSGAKGNAMEWRCLAPAYPSDVRYKLQNSSLM